MADPDGNKSHWQIRVALLVAAGLIATIVMTVIEVYWG